MRYLPSLLAFAFAGIAVWLFWGPMLQFGYSLIPETAEHAWVGKLIVTALIAYCGGVALPVGLVFLALLLFGAAINLKS